MRNFYLNNFRRLKLNARRYLFTNFLLNLFIFLLFIIIFLFFFQAIAWLLLEANWDVITSNLYLFTFGSFPKQQYWRPTLWLFSLLFLTLITLFGADCKLVQKNLLYGWISTIPLGIYLLYGGGGLTPVMSRNIGGLILTILLTICSSLLSLPIGIILAFCRKSKLLLVKKISSLYIDTMRAIPLIAVLFFGQLLIPLFLPIGITFDRVWRAIFAFTLFVSAYIAEDIRCGLQSIPKTQIEAANSLGLNQIQIIRLILVPQSLRIALPALTNQCIGLFQNTSLMAILGLVELLGIGRSLLANPKFIGQYMEVYIWLAVVYWLGCTTMAYISRSIERRMKTSKEIF
tara:strand:- start:874 stop:1908 length:1035 start_codon:yes stop_codon:yes gene_type:complete